MDNVDRLKIIERYEVLLGKYESVTERFIEETAICKSGDLIELKKEVCELQLGNIKMLSEMTEDDYY